MTQHSAGIYRDGCGAPWQYSFLAPCITFFTGVNMLSTRCWAPATGISNKRPLLMAHKVSVYRASCRHQLYIREIEGWHGMNCHVALRQQLHKILPYLSTCCSYPRSVVLRPPSQLTLPTCCVHLQLDLGFHRYNIQQTIPGTLPSRPPGHNSSEILTTQIGSTLVRSLPVGDSSGFVDVPEGNPTDPSNPTVSEDLLLAYSGQGSGTSAATQPPQQEMATGNRSSSTSSKGQAADRELLNAHFYPTMPSGDAAHNAAHCEPIPGDWPEPAPEMKPADAVSPDELLEVIHALGQQHTGPSGPVGGTSAGEARDDSSLQGHGASGQQQHPGDSSGSASKPANDLEGVKAVVREETTTEHPQGSDYTS